MLDFSNHFKAFSPELFMIIALCFIFSYGIVYSTSLSYGRPIIVKNMLYDIYVIRIMMMTTMLELFVLVQQKLHH